MTAIVVPCFVPSQAEAEGVIIGQLLAGYGELELELADCVIAAIGNYDAAIKVLFRERGEQKRIERADSMIKAKYEYAGLGASYKQAISDMNWCRCIRNQYAHSHWYYTDAEGLCFVDLEYTAKLSTVIETVMEHRHPIDTSLLERQANFSIYVKNCFWFLAESYRRFDKITKSPEVLLSSRIHALPARVARPQKHN